MIRFRAYLKGRADTVWMWSVRDRKIKALTWVFSLSNGVNGGTICSDGHAVEGKACGGGGGRKEEQAETLCLTMMHLRHSLDIQLVLLSGKLAP